MVRALKPDPSAPALASINYRVFFWGAQPDSFESTIGSEVQHHSRTIAEKSLSDYEVLLREIYAGENLQILNREILEINTHDPNENNWVKKFEDRIRFEVR